MAEMDILTDMFGTQMIIYSSPDELRIAIDNEVARIAAIDGLYCPVYTNPYSLYICEEEIEVHIRQPEKPKPSCSFCSSIGRPRQVIETHNISDCEALKRMRCEFCAQFGHTGGHCQTKVAGQTKLRYTCRRCWKNGEHLELCSSHVDGECVSAKISFYNKRNTDLLEKMRLK